MAAAFRRRHIDISAHLTPEELALLAEGKAGEAAERFRSHLAHCKNCFQAYQDAVEFRARALAGEEPHAPPELVKNGRKVPLRRGKKRRVTRAPRGRMILATAGGLAALAAVLIFLGPGAGPKFAPLRDLNARASVNLVYPDRSGGVEWPTIRAGEIEPSPEAREIMDQLQARAVEGRASSSDLLWLASAELATGNLDMARLHLQQAHADANSRFLKLRAILAYSESHLTDAERDLRAVLETNPNDDEAVLNLGIVLLENGKTPEALSLLQRARDSRSPQIAQRAQNILDSLSQTNSH
jgi:tetratricopeptide (TPR) repeat protein